MRIKINEYDAVKMLKYIQENSPVYEQLKEKLNLQEKMYAELNETHQWLNKSFNSQERLLQEYEKFISSDKEIASKWAEYKKSLYSAVMTEEATE